MQETVVPIRKLGTTKQTIKIYWHASWKYKHDVLLACLQPIGNIFINVGMPYFAGHTLAAIAKNNGTYNAQLRLLIIVIIIGIVFNRIGFLRLMVLQAKVMSDLNTRVFTRLLARGTQYHTNQVSGKLVS